MKEPHAELEAVEVDWARPPDGWQRTNWRLRRVDEDERDHANRIRAQVVEGLAPAEALSFAERLEAER
jgi:hypothetical protein